MDIGALHRRFPGITWHSFADWAKDEQARLAQASGIAPPPARPPKHRISHETVAGPPHAGMNSAALMPLDDTGGSGW